MRISTGFIAAAAMLGLAPAAANAATVVLTFEGLGDNAPIGDYYNGGAGGNYGISFGSSSLALIQNTSGGSGNFSNAPSGNTVAYFLTGSGAVMNVAAGFNTGFSFFYADQVGFTGNIQVYDGLNGTGNVLASLSLPSTPNPYTVFAPIGVAFAGTAKSVLFGGSANYIAFDNITLGAATPVVTTAVPEAATWAMMMVGLGAVGGTMRRRGKVRTRVAYAA